jgi:TRAP-type mannitol/chloroaromatic compound transport system substrate-binding protein
MKNVINTLIVFVFLSTSTLAADPVTLRLAETWGPNFPIFGEATKRMAALAKEMSGGRLTIEIASADKHGEPLGIFNLVKDGRYDMGHSASYYWKDAVPNTLFFTTMPFGMIASEQYAWFYYGDGMALMDEVYRDHGMYSFPGGNTGQQMGGWFQKEIKSLSDLRGLKMRIPGFAGELMSELGVNTVNIPSVDLNNALADGRIDALEWVGPSLDFDMGFSDIAKYYYTGWHEPATELQFLVNRKTMDSLPVDLREILKLSMRLAAYDMWVQSTHMSGKNWQRMQDARSDIQVRRFPDDVMKALHEANNRKLREKALDDSLAARIIESQANYLKQTRAWVDISERAYIGNMDARGNRR